MRHILLIGAAAIVACSANEDPVIINPDVPEQPDGTLRLISPTFEVSRGTETFQCMRLPFEATQDIYIQATRAYQSQGGHHSVLYYSSAPAREDPHECDEGDMRDFRLLGIGTAQGGGMELPAGIAFRLPAGAGIYVQSHYLNVKDQSITVQDVIDLTVIPADEVASLAGGFAQMDVGFELAPGQETTRVLDCAFPVEGMTIPWLVPHMHEHGTHYKIELVHGDSAEVVYDSPWRAALRNDAPVIDLDALQVGPGDRIRTHCTWNNTGAEPITFPQEMCITFMPYYPSPDGAFLACDENGVLHDSR